MWANAQRDGRPPEYIWLPPAERRNVWLMPTTRRPCSNDAKIGEHKTWMQSEFCTW